MSPEWKGKQRALFPRADSGDGSGTAAGVVLPLELVGSGVFDAAYTVPISIGQNNQQFSLQVDTGSSDLWVASTSCSSSACGQTGGHNYDPSSSGTPTGHDFSIQYLSGAVSGPIYWDLANVGGYSIENQALAAATSVSDETLAPDFSGILGLALPLNSIIASTIPPVTNNTPDGAAWASNLFSITPTSTAPSSHFLSLSLSRPGSDRIPSYLGIGKHPPDLVSDPSKVMYASVVSDSAGSLFWKASVRDITVWVGGQQRTVDIGRSNTGAVFPSAVIDSGVPFILTTSATANAIYGAIDVHPAQDGNYYVPCKTPLNMTITLDDRTPLPLHPLDLTAEPPTDNNADFCTGLIQSADAQLLHPTTNVGDMILGVPFMRNVYTVMAYTVPQPDGSFPPGDTSSSPSSVSDSDADPLRPRLGLMSLTDPTQALSEFNTVRVLQQPLSSDPNKTTFSDSALDGKKLSVGIIVLISLLAFFAFCCGMFLIRWLLYRRRFKRERERERSEGWMDDKRELAYQLSGRGSSEFGGGMPSEDTLRAMRYEAYMKKERTMSSYSSRSQTTPDQDQDCLGDFGVVGHKDGELWNGDTLVGPNIVPMIPPPTTASLRSSRHSRSSSDPERLKLHQRTSSEMPTPHQRLTSIATPLLAEHHLSQHDDDDEDDVQHHVPYRDHDEDNTHRQG